MSFNLHFCINLLIVGSLYILTSNSASTSKPNIIFFLTDDWGFNDVGYYGNSQTETPFIDSLVETEGLRIDRHYVLPECTVTRCALLTGRYPMRYGMQDGVLYYTSGYALSRYETLLSNEFKNNGYHTHLIGKWHIGMRSWDYTPTYRGFDTFLGYYGGLMYYFSHYGRDFNYHETIDFHLNEDGYNTADVSDVYSLRIYTNRINDLLQNEAADDNDEPFFMYVAWQGSHDPSEAPDAYTAVYLENNNVNDTTRINFQAQTTYTDDMLMEIVGNLKALDLWDNTLLVFASDNGASDGYGDNSPLRGAKFTLWEGGVRVPAFLSGGYLPTHLRGQVFNKYAIHVTDWYQTLLTGVAGGEVTSANELDGYNMWDYLIEDNSNVDNNNDNKNDENSEIDSEIEEDEQIEGDAAMSERYMLLNVDSNHCETESGVCGAVIYGGRWKLFLSNNAAYSSEKGVEHLETCFWSRNYAKIQDSDLVLECLSIPEDVDNYAVNEEVDCPCTYEPCLFDLVNDPCEYYDVSEEHVELTKMIFEKLEEFYNDQVTPLSTVIDEADYDTVDPTQWVDDDEQSYWVPWDTEYDNWQDIPFEQLLASNYDVEGALSEKDELVEIQTSKNVKNSMNSNKQLNIDSNNNNGNANGNGNSVVSRNGNNVNNVNNRNGNPSMESGNIEDDIEINSVDQEVALGMNSIDNEVGSVANHLKHKNTSLIAWIFFIFIAAAMVGAMIVCYVFKIDPSKTKNLNDSKNSNYGSISANGNKSESLKINDETLSALESLMGRSDGAYQTTTIKVNV